MAPIPLKRIVSVSSEDSLNPARNLLSCSGRKWLCATDNNSGRAEVVIELSKRTRIASIALGNFGSAFVEVFVGDSTSSELEHYMTLLPQSTLMTVPDSRRGRNKTRSMTYGRDKLSSAAMTKKWNRIKLRCRQPFNLTDQFGLQFVAISSDIADSSSPVLLTPPHTPRLLSPSTPSTPTLPTFTSTTPESENVIARHGKRFPTLPNIKSPAVSSSKNDQIKVSTPKRPLREHSNMGKEDFEFSGVEKQSRLFRNALRGTPSDHCSEKVNPILEKIMSEREKYRKSSSELAMCDTYERKKLLKKDLPKAETNVDFAASYDKSKSKHKDVAIAMSKVYAHDDKSEIGEEPGESWARGRGRKRKKKTISGSPGGKEAWQDLGSWLTKRKKINGMIDECWAILDKAGGGEGTCTSGPPDSTELHDEKVETAGNDSDSDATIICDYGDTDGDGGDTTIVCNHDHMDSATACNDVERDEPVFVECPLCNQFFPEYAIQVHASTCGDDYQASSWIPVVVD